MGRGFNTLAQNGTANSGHGGPESATIIRGRGSELGNDKALKNRAKRKVISQCMAMKLVKVCEGNEDMENLKTFRNTYYCQNRIVTHGSSMHGDYCKNRLCTLCCSIRKAHIINEYLPTLSTWKRPHLVTLTIKACSAKSLRIFMQGVIKAFKQIVEKYRKRHQRKGTANLVGVKSLECNFNPIRRTYNPHLHVIVANEQMGRILIDEWLEKWTKGYTIRKAQHIRPVGNMTRDLIEVIKYGSKIFTEPDLKKKGSGDRNIYVKALYKISCAMKGLRIFDRFGFNLPKSEVKPVGTRVVTEYQEWIFMPAFFDWINTENGHLLSGYDPPPELIMLLEQHVDLEKD